MKMRGRIHRGCYVCGTSTAGPDCPERKPMTRSRERAQWRREVSRDL